MNQRPLKSILLFMFVVLGLTVCSYGVDPIDMADLSGWDIVVAPGAISSVNYGAQELRDFIQQAGGSTLPIVTSISGPNNHIFVGTGTDMAASNVGFSVAGFGLEELRIIIGDENIAIAGNGYRGTLYGVYTFLENYLGVRFLTADHTYVPLMGTELLVGPVDYSYDPPFGRYRANGYPMVYNDPVFGTRLRDNSVTSDLTYGGKTPYRNMNHSFHRQVPISVYGAGGSNPHPEYYGLWGGTRRDYYMHTHLCVTNDASSGFKTDLVDIVSDSVIDEIQDLANPGWKNFSVSNNDTIWQYCQTANCIAFDAAQESQMGALLEFVNLVADEVALSYPDLFIGTMAYGFSRKPPKTIVPRDNVQINLCGHLVCCQLHPINDPTCPTNVSFKSDLEGWDVICNNDNLYAWIYGIDFYDRLIPYPNWYIFKPNIQSLVNHDVQGVYVQNATTNMDALFDMADMRNYLIANLLWDPSRDTDDVINEFINLHYGNAATYVRQFIDLVHNHYAASGIHNLPSISGQWDLPIDEGVATAGVALFVQAVAAAENATVQARVEKASHSAYRAAIDPIWKLPEGSTVSRSFAQEMEPLVDEFFRLSDELGSTSYVLSDRIRITAILQSALIYDHGNWSFEDNFNSYSPESILNGTNGWVDAYGSDGVVYESIKISSLYQAEETSGGWGTSYPAGVGRDISADVGNADGNNYEARICVYGQYHSFGYVDYSFLSVGDDSLIQDMPYSSRNRHELYVDNRNSTGIVYLRTVDDGAITSSNVWWNKDTYVWSELKIMVDMDAGVASAWWRDVDDYTLEPFGDGEWTKFGDFPGSIPYAAPTAVSFAAMDYGRADNFRSGKDYPSDCAEAISLGFGSPWDFNNDCHVDLVDIAMFMQDWARCVDPNDDNCERPWE